MQKHKHKHPCPKRDSNPRSEQASGHRVRHLSYSHIPSLNNIKIHVQSPSWESKGRSACQPISHYLWKYKLHYRIHKSPAWDSILSHMNPGHTLSYLLYFNLIILFTPVFKVVPVMQFFQLKLRMRFSTPSTSIFAILVLILSYHKTI
jgi:hypothetical protein